MSNVIPITYFNSARSVMDSARKIGESLDEMPIERHLTIVEMLKAHLSLRITEHQKKAKAEQEAAMQEAADKAAEAEREAKFSIQAGVPIGNA